MTNLPDLSALPPPAVIEELSYEVILDDILAVTAAVLAAKGFAWTVGSLETDPFVIVAEAYAYREVSIRSRMNYNTGQTFLEPAEGSNLDQLTAWLGVTRLQGESDARLKERYRLATYGRSAGGPKERYRAIALGADINVRNVAVYTEGRDPTVNVAVLSTLGNGEPTPALLATVETALDANDVRVVSDRFNVLSAIRKTVDVELAIRLSDTALNDVGSQVEAKVQSDWQGQDLLGLDLTLAFLVGAAVQVNGVTNVEVVSPTTDQMATENEAIAIGTVTVTISGRGR